VVAVALAVQIYLQQVVVQVAVEQAQDVLIQDQLRVVKTQAVAAVVAILSQVEALQVAVVQVL
jgi:uncharacterized protein (DUF1778 family)